MRIRALGFGLLSLVSLAQAGRNAVESEFSFTDPMVPPEITYGQIEQCYDDPAGTQLRLDNIWREVQPEDDASVAQCLTKSSQAHADELAKLQSSEAVKPYAEELERVISSIAELANDPGTEPPATLVAEQESVLQKIDARDRDLHDHTMKSLLWLIGAVASSAPLLFSLEHAGESKRSRRVLHDTYNFNAKDVTAALTEELQTRDESAAPARHRLTPQGQEHALDVVFLPDSKAAERTGSLFELQNALQEQAAQQQTVASPTNM